MKFSDPRLKQLSENKMNEWRRWFDTRLDDAIEAAAKEPHPEIESKHYIIYLFRLVSFDYVVQE